MDRRDARSMVEALQELLISRATGGGGSNGEYQFFREELRNDPELHPLLPRYLARTRDLDQFWSYIQKQDGTYRGRREHIWASFEPLLQALEKEPAGARAPAARRRTKAPAGDENVRAFISYSSVDKDAAAAVKHALGAYGIECFLAHDDIHVSQEWRDRILEELAACQVFIVLLSAAFRASEWGPQEIGAIAHRKEVPVVPLTLDATTPFGFITHIQGKPVPATGLDPETILDPLVQKFPRTILPRMIDRVGSARTHRAADASMRPLAAHFGRLADEELRNLVEASIKNSQVWDAQLCRDEYLPRLIRSNRNRIDRKQLRALEYQLHNGSWYNGT